jgi:hypothetical protein
MFEMHLAIGFEVLTVVSTKMAVQKIVVFSFCNVWLQYIVPGFRFMSREKICPRNVPGFCKLENKKLNLFLVFRNLTKFQSMENGTGRYRCN